MKPKWLLPILLLTASQLAAQDPGPAIAPAENPSIDQIVERMAAARQENRERLRAYVVTREYRLAKGKERGDEVIADISFVPPAAKQYSIREGDGNAERIVRRVLDKEKELAGSDRSDLTHENYEFALLGRETFDARDCFVLQLKPRRKDTSLLRGKAWVDAGTYQIRKIEGEPSKSPSWWVRDLILSFTYGEVGGMWLQTQSLASARVRLLGRRTLASRSIGYRAAIQQAGTPRAKRPRAAASREFWPASSSATRTGALPAAPAGR